MEKLQSLLIDVEPVMLESYIRKNNLKNEIIACTSFLENPTMSQRIWHILNLNYEPVVKCPICGINPGNFGRYEIREDGKRVRAIRMYRPCSIECRKKFISINITKTEESRKKKFVDTCLARYGVTHPMKVESIKYMNASAVKKVYKENYINIIQKQKITNLSKYGVEFHQQTKSAREQAKIMTKAKYENRIYTLKENLTEKYKKIIGEEYELIEYVSYQELKIKHCKCGHVDTYRVDMLNRRLLVEGYILCLKCSPLNYTVSGLERQVADYVRSFDIEPECTNRTLIKPKQLDIVVHEHKLAIEFNGLYFHSDATKSIKYHQEKSLETRNKGYHLLHIWEDDWVSRQEIMKSIISGFLNEHARIYARNCKIEHIDTKESREFMEKSHIQGFVSASLYFGLKYNDELVLLMSFTRKEDNKWELSRLCSKLHTSVIGGASKLFAHFIKVYKPKSITTYCDLSIFPGSIYLKLGFELKHLTYPQYWYYNPSIGVKRLHRRSFQKKILLKSNPDCSNLSEKDIMMMNGYYRVYGCGNFVYEWINKI